MTAVTVNARKHMFTDSRDGGGLTATATERLTATEITANTGALRSEIAATEW